jgi:catechol 2,3-dioxygenase-like lactoylglutathione lyase family enzyme
MAIRKAHHHSFTVSDMDRSIRFYRDLLGLELIQDAVRANLESYDQIAGYRNVDLRIVMLRERGGDFILELIEYRNPPAQIRELQNYYVGASHVCFLVDDMQAEYKRLSAAGVRFNSPPVEIVRDGKWVGTALYLFDPDGITVELEQPAS